MNTGDVHTHVALGTAGDNALLSIIVALALVQARKNVGFLGASNTIRIYCNTLKIEYSSLCGYRHEYNIHCSRLARICLLRSVVPDGKVTLYLPSCSGSTRRAGFVGGEPLLALALTTVEADIGLLLGDAADALTWFLVLAFGLGEGASVMSTLSSTCCSLTCLA